MGPRYDGFVSRTLNRRFSDPAARLLAKTWLTPNQATLGAATIGIFSFVSFVLGQNIIGGVLGQLYIFLMILAVLTNLTVLNRFVSTYLHFRATKPLQKRK